MRLGDVSSAEDANMASPGGVLRALRLALLPLLLLLSASGVSEALFFNVHKEVRPLGRCHRLLLAA
jgi:hypothetical protein